MFARTKRFTLRPGWPEDAASVTDAIAHEAVVTMLTSVAWHYTRRDADAFLTHSPGPTEAAFLILPHDEPTPRIVGGIGLRNHAGMSELVFWRTPISWGRGYATEAGHAVLDTAHRALGIKRIVARYIADKAASGNVLAKLGFVSTGWAVQHSRAQGQAVTYVEMVLDLHEARPVQLAA